jgi:hypothetical protein
MKLDIASFCKCIYDYSYAYVARFEKSINFLRAGPFFASWAFLLYYILETLLNRLHMTILVTAFFVLWISLFSYKIIYELPDIVENKFIAHCRYFALTAVEASCLSFMPALLFFVWISALQLYIVLIACLIVSFVFKNEYIQLRNWIERYIYVIITESWWLFFCCISLNFGFIFSKGYAFNAELSTPLIYLHICVYLIVFSSTIFIRYYSSEERITKTIYHAFQYATMATCWSFIMPALDIMQAIENNVFAQIIMFISGIVFMYNFAFGKK